MFIFVWVHVLMHAHNMNLIIYVDDLALLLHLQMILLFLIQFHFFFFFFITIFIYFHEKCYFFIFYFSLFVFSSSEFERCNFISTIDDNCFSILITFHVDSDHFFFLCGCCCFGGKVEIPLTTLCWAGCSFSYLPNQHDKHN